MELSKALSDSALVDAIKSGQHIEPAIRSMYRDYFGSLSWYVLNNNGNQQDAEDIFQEVVVCFIELVQKNKFRGESTVKTFLFSLARHTWLNELKRRGRAWAREEKFENAQDHSAPDTSYLIADREARMEISKLVGELGEHCRTILLLYYYENKSMKEILQAMHYENEQVVRNKKYKCLKQLEEMIRERPFLKQTLINLLHG